MRTKPTSESKEFYYCAVENGKYIIDGKTFYLKANEHYTLLFDTEEGRLYGLRDSKGVIILGEVVNEEDKS